MGVVAVVGGDLAEWIGDGADLPTATDTRICQAKVTVGGGVIDVGTWAFDAGEQAIGVVGGERGAGLAVCGDRLVNSLNTSTGAGFRAFYGWEVRQMAVCG